MLISTISIVLFDFIPEKQLHIYEIKGLQTDYVLIFSTILQKVKKIVEKSDEKVTYFEY